MYLMKGADSVMIPRVAEHGKKNAYMEEVVDDYACHGEAKLWLSQQGHRCRIEDVGGCDEEDDKGRL